MSAILENKKIDIYLCSSFKNSDINNELISLFESNNYSIFSPARDTPQEDPDLIFKYNSEAIRIAKLILVVLENYYGKDLAWEVGFAYGLSKRILFYFEGKSNYEINDIMLRGTMKNNVVKRDEILYRIKSFGLI